MTALSGNLRSVNHPAHYLNQLDYSTHIQGPRGSRVFLYFTHLDIEWQATCLYDYLQIGLSESDAQPIKICGQHESDLDSYDYLSLDNSVTIKFHSDFSVTATGFSANWEILDVSTACGTKERPVLLSAASGRKEVINR